MASIHSVDEFAIGVPDLMDAERFYDAFGLQVRREGDALGLYTVGHPHRWGRVYGGLPCKKLMWLTLGAYEEELAEIRRQVKSVGASESVPPPQADAGGFWIRSPDGVPMQVRPAQKCSPSSPAPREFTPATGMGHALVGRSPARSKVQKVNPLYLSHLLLFTADVDQAMDFFCSGLGLRLSDRSGSSIAFLHSPHGSDHHLIALAKSSGPGLHHTSWCVPSIDAVGLGMEQMSDAGYGEGWGVGRHVLGSNYFRYVKDPWGSFAEYSYDIDYIPAGAQWPAADHPGADSLYVWGPAVPADFIRNTEIEV
ncbi:catechol 2,3-dioxygenase [Variovorax sp. YR752]|uniref:VOC family protein n=1 Tax=Variovorax sp. YR752 TaxID=1884383 RepID=UPI000BCBE028|nr:VOC family protein [Variovorax sp. YR752]SOE06286.1 catechol 2,3-dioxygenase [Variovorax sp. YR752]